MSGWREVKEKTGVSWLRFRLIRLRALGLAIYLAFILTLSSSLFALCIEVVKA